MYKILFFLSLLTFSFSLEAQPTDPYFVLDIDNITKSRTKNFQIENIVYSDRLNGKIIFLKKGKETKYGNRIKLNKIGGVGHIEENTIFFIYKKDTMQVNFQEWKNSLFFKSINIKQTCFRKGIFSLNFNEYDKQTKNNSVLLINNVFCGCQSQLEDDKKK
ncbi:MAG: hypothetical protein ACK5MD_06210 [Flavobacteriales bacterium]